MFYSERMANEEGLLYGRLIYNRTGKEFVVASHFNLDRVKELYTQYPALLTARHQWGENDFEDGLGAASHVGNRSIAEFFLTEDVPLTMAAASRCRIRSNANRNPASKGWRSYITSEFGMQLVARGVFCVILLPHHSELNRE